MITQELQVQSSDQPPKSPSPETTPSTVSDIQPLRSTSPNLSRKRKFSRDSLAMPSENAAAGSKRARVEDSFLQWPTVRSSSPSPQKRSPLRNVQSKANVPAKRVELPPTRTQAQRKTQPSTAAKLKSRSSSRSPSKGYVKSAKAVSAKEAQTANQKARDDPTPSTDSSKVQDAIVWQTIEAPMPMTSENRYRTHKTQLLKNANVHSKIGSFYQPRDITREIKALERGYWRFPIPLSWTVEESRKFERYLRQLIAEGRAGWGSWLEPVPREEIRAGPKHSEELASSNAEPRMMLDLRFWCWGEVVREVWLAIFMGAHNDIKKGLEMTWVDSAGEVVMRTKLES